MTSGTLGREEGRAGLCVINRVGTSPPDSKWCEVMQTARMIGGKGRCAHCMRKVSAHPWGYNTVYEI